MQAQGFVEAVSAKNKTKAGKSLRSPLYSFKVGDDWFGCGFDNPNIEKGDTIEFSFTEGDYGKEADVSSISKKSNAEVKQAATSKSAGVSVAGDRQTSIVYQSQHRDAVEFIKFAVEQGAIQLPAKKADKYDVLLNLVECLTVDWTLAALDPDLSGASVGVDSEPADAEDDE